MADVGHGRWGVERATPVGAWSMQAMVAVRARHACVRNCTEPFAYVACAQPVPEPLPSIVFVAAVWAGWNVVRTCTALAPPLPFYLGLQLERACVQQRLLERQELFRQSRRQTSL